MLNLTDCTCAYSSLKYPCYARQGMVATSNALAAQAGLNILRKGGNAVDAALATATCLTVCEPTSNGIGGDAFAIVSFQGELFGLNASGPAPHRVSLEALQKQGHNEIPAYGFAPVTVPGVVAGWVALAQRFGKLPLTEVFADAIDYACHGYTLSPVVAKFWNRAYQVYLKNLKGDEFNSWFETFAPEGRAPLAGEIVRLPNHAHTLNLIAETKGAAFYQGSLAEKIDAFSRQYGGYLRGEDLANYQVEWVQPLASDYRGYRVWELPPNGHGIVVLMALNILRGFETNGEHATLSYHRQIEAIKLAFEAVGHHLTDPRKMLVSVEELLSEDWAQEQRKRIGKSALLPLPTRSQAGGTVYLASADAEGNMVSFIQSNYMGFGSGLVVPGTGIALHNRGRNFSSDPRHVNCLEPGKKPYHTIIPGFLTQNGRHLGPFGVMGGFMQPQGHVQVVMNMIDFAHNPQAALDAPRWQWMEEKTVQVEQSMSPDIVQSLAELGHEIVVAEENHGFGRGQVILRSDQGVLAGATETRVDGTVAGF